MVIDQSRREGERNETLDTTVHAMAALHGLVSMGLGLNEEAVAMAVTRRRADASAPAAQPAPPVIRSAWMG